VVCCDIIIERVYLLCFWTRNWSPIAANLVVVVVVVVVRGRRSLKSPKAPSLLVCMIGMKFDTILLSNIPHRLTVFDFSFLTLEARYTSNF
jgi:hypothetical protein